MMLGTIFHTPYSPREGVYVAKLYGTIGRGRTPQEAVRNAILRAIGKRRPAAVVH